MVTTVFGGLLSSSGLAEKDEQGGKERVCHDPRFYQILGEIFRFCFAGVD
jgi:hypothetical protein